MIKNKLNFSGISILVTGLVLCCAGSSWGIIVVNPPWSSSAANTTHQAWEFTYPTYDPLDSSPQIDDNPYGTPSIDFSDGTSFWDGSEGTRPLVPGPYGDPIPTWHVDVDGGGFTVLIPNAPDPNPWKHIFYQVTSNKAPNPSGPTSFPAGTHKPGTAYQHAGGWYTYTGQIDITPNPQYETVTFTFPSCTNIEEIVIDTICVPEPIMMGLLGAGGLMMLRVRRKV